MKNKRIMSIIMAVALIFTLLPATLASAKVKLSTSSTTLEVGKTKTIKISGAKSAKWSVTGNCIKITKKSKKSVKIKAVSTGTAYLNAKVKKQTYLCMVTVTQKKNDVSPTPVTIPDTTPVTTTDTHDYVKAKDKIEQKYLFGNNEAVGIFKNNNTFDVSLRVKMVFYDASGNILDYSSSSNSCFPAGKTCALSFYCPKDTDYNPVEFASYTTEISVDEVYSEDNTDKIEIHANMGTDSLMLQTTNNSGKKLDWIDIFVIYYDAENNLIGYRETYADCEDIGSTSTDSIYFPYDDEFNTIIPASYEVYLNCAYRYVY